MQRELRAGHLAAGLTMLIWGTTFISTKVLLRQLSPVICTPFTGHPVEGVLLCGTHMSTKGNV